MQDHDFRTYVTNPQSLGKIFHFASTGHRRIRGELACYLEILGIPYILYKITTVVFNNLRRELSDKNRLAFSTFSVKIMGYIVK